MPNLAAWDIIFIFLDGNGQQAQFRVHIAPHPENIDLESYAQALAVRADLLTGAQLIDIQVARSIQLPSELKTEPLDQSDNESAGQLTFEAQSTALTRLLIPAFLTDYILPNTKRIDLDNLDVKDFTNWVIDGYFSAYVTASDGSDVLSVKSGTQHYSRTRTSRNA